MGSPTIYMSTDANAPQLTNYNQPTYEILKACLVDGYPGKAAAGWSVVHDDYDTNGIFTITNALQTGVMGLVKSAYGQADVNIFVADAMIDATHAVNARSGRSAISSITDLDTRNDQHRFMHRPSWFYQNWAVIANENFVILLMGRYQHYLTNVSQSSNRDYGCMLMFGAAKNPRNNDIGLGDFMVYGGFVGQAWTTFRTGQQATTYLYGYSGSVSNDVCYGFLHPFGYSGGTRHGFSNAGSGSVAELPLQSPYLFTGTTSDERNSYQHFVVPGLFTEQTLWGNQSKDILLQNFSTKLTDIYAADKNYVLVSDLAAGPYFYVSMDAVDWP